MKKLMLTATACAAMAFGAKADFSVADLTKGLPSNWGYATEGLGAKGDEVALVFTNTAPSKAMSFTLPDFVHEVRYLVVGGGGAGGASGNSYGAGGGGAGGVVQNATPLVVAGGETVTAVVGAGSPKVGPNDDKGTHGGNGNKSTLTIGGNTFTAYRGAGGGQGVAAGYGNTATSSQPTACGGGSGGNYGRDTDLYIAGGAGDVSNGGIGHGGGGGGGGAGGNGYDWNAGGGMAHVGGPGVVTTIFTDEEQTIAGGGCGNGGRTKVTNPSGGGGYAGSIDDFSDFNAGDGTTWGAGGGAGTGRAKSGAGYQGVVVVRFSTTVAANVPVMVPVIASKAYTGETLTADVEDTDEYAVTENAGGVNAGTYDVVLHLKDHEPPYAWQDDGSTDDRTLPFVITKATDTWATAPALSKTAWRYSDEPAVVTVGVSARGETAVVTYDDGLADMPVGVGDHTATFTVVASDNYEKLETVINFAINKDTNAWTVEPSVTPDTWVRGEGRASFFNAPAAKYGETVTVVYDNDLVKLAPDLEGLGEHTVKYSVDEGDTYEALEKTITYTVTKKINGWMTAPVVKDGNIEDGMPEFTPPTAASGGEVTVYYDGDKSIVEPPTAMGNHTVTYTVAEDEDEDGYQGYTQTLAYKVTYKMVYDQANPSVVCGYRLPGLGANSNEVAVVFTNTAAGTMTFALPKYVTEISYLVVGGGASGGRSANSYTAGGGGAGGVVTNEGPYAVEGGATLEVAVGAGGDFVTGVGSGNSGLESSLAVGGESIVALPGGGGGYFGDSKNGGNGLGGETIACGGGASGYNNNKRTGGKGQTSNGADSTGGRAGGGGAGGNGYANTDEGRGQGGIGVPVTIFGDTYAPDNTNGYYIAGGGCGAWANQNDKEQTSPLGGGGCGGGKNNIYWDRKPQSGSRWGAGGGGVSGGATYPSGAGYQGVVVVRYVEAANLAVMPAVPEVMYTGELQIAQLVGGQGFKVVANEGGVEAGTYAVKIALADGYSAWEDGVTDEQRTLEFVITRADHNEWNPEPSITKDTWTTTDENPGVLTAGRTTFGPVTATYTRNGVEKGAFDGTLPTEAGTYVITYVAPDETDSYVTVAEEDRVKTVEFMIVMENAVAKVGDYDTYETVAEAFAAAKDGDTVLMLQNATVDAPVEVTNDVKLVLAGYEVAAGEQEPDTLFLVKDGAVFTLDGSAVGSLLAGGICVESGTLNLANTKIVATGDAIVAGAGNVTLNLGAGSDVTSTDGYAIRETYADAEATAVHAISVTGGTYRGELGTFVATAAFDAAMEAGTATCAFEKAGYTKPIDAKYVAAGHLQKKLADGTYCIGPAADTEALTYTWNGNGETNLWQVANWSINKELAPDAYVGFPNSYDLATVRFSADAAPIEVELADNVGLKKCVFDAGTDPVTVDLAGRKLNVNKNGPDNSNQITYSTVFYSNQSPVTFKNGEIGASGCFWFRADDTEVVFDNVDAALPETGSSLFAFRMLEDARMNSGVYSGCKIRIQNGSVMSGGLHLCSKAEGNRSEFIVDNSKWSGGITFGTCASGFLIAAQNGGTVSLGSGWWDYQGSGATLRAEGKNADGKASTVTVTMPTANTYGHVLKSSDNRWEAVAGGEFTFNAPTYDGFVAGGDLGNGDADRRNVFFVSNGTMKVNRTFSFGIHTNDTDCVSPTIALAGTNATFKTEKAFVFGTDAVLANPPLFELNPAANGLRAPCVTSDANSITIGSNVCVKVVTDGIRATGGMKARVTLARVKATGTLAVDVDQLAANTTVVNGSGEPDGAFRVKYAVRSTTVAGVEYRDLVVSISNGGFAVIVR